MTSVLDTNARGINRSLVPNIFRNKERITFEKRQTPGTKVLLLDEKNDSPGTEFANESLRRENNVEKCFIQLHTRGSTRTNEKDARNSISPFVSSTCNIHRRRNYELVESLSFAPLSISFRHVDNSSKVFHQLLPNSMETRATYTCAPLIGGTTPFNLLRWNDVPRTSRICPKIAIFSQF